SIALIMLIFSLTVGLEQGNHLVSLLLPTSLVLLLWFVFRQRRRQKKQSATLLDLALFNYKNFNMAVLAVALFMMMLDAYFFVLAIFFQDGLQLSPVHAGYFVVFQGGGFILASSYTARFVLRFGKGVLIA